MCEPFVNHPQIYKTRETPAFGGTSLALRGTGATRQTTAIGGGKRRKKEKKLGCLGPPYGAAESAALGGVKK